MEQAEKETVRAASEGFPREFKTLIDAEDLDSLKQLQHLILGRLQDSNAVVSHFNENSEHCFDEVSGDFCRNTRLLRSMKSDLDYIFQKLRHMPSSGVNIICPTLICESSKCTWKSKNKMKDGKGKGGICITCPKNSIKSHFIWLPCAAILSQGLYTDYCALNTKVEGYL